MSFRMYCARACHSTPVAEQIPKSQSLQPKKCLKQKKDNSINYTPKYWQIWSVKKHWKDTSNLYVVTSKNHN